MKITDGRLTFGDLGCEQLLQQFGSPLYVYEEEAIRRQCRRLKSSFTSDLPMVIHYACKANTNLRILGIYEPPGTRVVQLRVDRMSSANIYGAVRSQASNTDMPMLVDSNGNTYSTVGYIHQSPDGIEIKLEPSDGISIGGLPHVPTAGNHRMRLLFQVTEGVRLSAFKVGDVPVAACNLTVEPKK